jgi:hypothetical protein
MGVKIGTPSPIAQAPLLAVRAALPVRHRDTVLNRKPGSFERRRPIEIYNPSF